MSKALKDWTWGKRISTRSPNSEYDMNVVDELIPTRESLLSRLHDLADHDGWKEFFDTYWRLIYATARKSALTDAEAQDVVQETMLSVAKSMPSFKYEKTGSFKSWLLNLTRWRITDQVRKRQKQISRQDEGSGTRTEAVYGIPDPASPLEDAWDQEWEHNIINAAIDRVKRRVDGKQYQVFELYVVKKWPVSRISRSLKINRGRVYLAKHRIGNLIKKEITHLRSKPI
jgi:RNA polymerase sigma-70 factor (ECF subfamily)